MDRYTETTSVSWGGRLMQSLAGVVVGFILIVGTPFVLFWNEGRAVTTARSLDEGAGIVLSLENARLDPGNEGRLVHLAGSVSPPETVTDPGFAVAAEALRLFRRVEMFQWKETSDSASQTKLGGGEETVTTYSYTKDWSTEAINSADFKQPDGYRNPRMDIPEQWLTAKQAKVGSFVLSKDVLELLVGWEPLALPENRQSAMRAAYRGSKRFTLVGDDVFLGANPDEPVIGDYRISWMVVAPGALSAIGRQTGSGLTGYNTKAGAPLLMATGGIVPAEAMFADAKAENATVAWIIRAAGLVVLFLGFMMVGGPLAVVADVIPFIGSIVRLGQGLLALCAALVLGGGTIALAWFVYRPLLAVALLVGLAAIIGLFVYAGRRKPKAVTA